MKEKHNVDSSDAITKGASGRLRGTHIYEVAINRPEGPPSAKTWSGLTKYFSFSYQHGTDGNLKSITAQEQGGLGRTNKISKVQVEQLWKGGENVGTGVSSKFEAVAAANVIKLPSKVNPNKQPSVEPPGVSNDTQGEAEIDNHDSSILQCPDCSTVFLRRGNILSHRRSGACKRKQQKNGNHPVEETTILCASIKRARQAQDLEIDKSEMQLRKEAESQSEWDMTI